MKEKRRNGNKLNKSDLGIIVMTLPTLLWYVAFCFIPLFGIIIAFKSYRMIPGRGFLYSLLQSDWVGLQNFRFMFLNPQMGMVIKNTIGYNLLFLLTDTILPIAFTIGLSKLYSGKLAKLTQTAALLPHFISWVAINYFVFMMLSFDRGILNRVLTFAGIDAVRWYLEPALWPAILILTHIWKSIGYSAVIYKAFMTGIDLCQYESALMDGASSWQMTKYITIPYLIPAAVTMLILNLGSLFTGSFGLFYQVTRNSASILPATETIDVYVYKALSENANYGFSAAASLLQNVCGCVLMLVSNAVITGYDPERGLFR